MPYGRGYKRRTVRPRKYGGRPYRRKTVKAPPIKKTTKRYVRNNANAINRIAKQVRYLKRSQYGDTQLNMVRSCKIRTPPSSALFADNYLQINNEEAFAFDVRDFGKRMLIPGVPAPQYNTGCPIWQRDNDSNTAYVSGCFDNLMGDSRFWTCNNDIVDGGKYLINYNKLQLQFRVMQWNGVKWDFPPGGTAYGPAYVDIRLVSHRKDAIAKWSSTDNKGLMPKAMAELGKGLASQENAVNPYYFKTWSHKRFVLDNRDLQTSLTKNVTMFLKPKGVNRQQLTVPEIPGSFDASNSDPITIYPYGQFNVSYTQPLWLIVSTSNPPPSPTPQTGELTMGCRIVSTRSWRDINGGAAL